MNSSAVSSLLLTLCLVLIISHHADARGGGGGGGSKLIGQVCNEALEHRANCMSVARSNPKILRAKNYVQLSKAILELGLNKGIQGQNFLKGLAASNNVPAIVHCANNDYDGVVGSFRSSLGELSEDPQTANYDAKVAGDGPDTCERGLAAARIVNPAISNLNKEIWMLSFMAFLATNHL